MNSFVAFGFYRYLLGPSGVPIQRENRTEFGTGIKEHFVWPTQVTGRAWRTPVLLTEILHHRKRIEYMIKSFGVVSFIAGLSLRKSNPL